jgi:tetratricopeptide (TPR) repeat protein
MNSNSYPNRVIVRATSLSLIAATFTGAGIIMAQQPPPVAPAPVAPPSAEPGQAKPPRAVVKPAPPAIADPVAPVAPKAVPPPPGDVGSSAYGEGGSIYRDSKRYGLPNTSLTPPAGAPVTALTRNMLDEELNSNPQAAAKTYEAMLAAFDRQRETAAQAIFRLGESYRRMGRVDEARSMYARILREFVDFPDLAKLSQRILTENAPTQSREISALTVAPSNPEEQGFMRQELALLEEELTLTEERIKAGMESTTSALPLKREILQLKQRLARSQAPTWEVPAPPNSTRTRATASWYRPGRAPDSASELERLENEVKDLKDQITLLSGEVQPEAVSTEIISDPRFATLKLEYEKYLLDVSGDPASKKALDNARDRLVKWIQGIYVPELKNSLSIKNARLEAFAKRSEPLKR